MSRREGAFCRRTDAKGWVGFREAYGCEDLFSHAEFVSENRIHLGGVGLCKINGMALTALFSVLSLRRS